MQAVVCLQVSSAGYTEDLACTSRGGPSFYVQHIAQGSHLQFAMEGVWQGDASSGTLRPKRQCSHQGMLHSRRLAAQHPL